MPQLFRDFSRIFSCIMPQLCLTWLRPNYAPTMPFAQIMPQLANCA